MESSEGSIFHLDEDPMDPNGDVVENVDAVSKHIGSFAAHL
jgi:hypothetical protein